MSEEKYEQGGFGRYVLGTLFLVAFLLGVIATIVVVFPNSTEYHTASSVTLLPVKKQVKIGLVGDIMLARGIPISIDKHGAGDPRFIFQNLNGLNRYDILFGNLEGVISDTGENVGSVYSFRMNPVFAGLLKEVGFSVLSVANNHSGDWSVTAFTDSLHRLTEEGIAYTGGGHNKEEAITPTIIEVKDKKIGFIGFSDVGPNWLRAHTDQAGILIAGDEDPDSIAAAKEQVDVLVVSYHFGEEYETESNERQQFLARRAIDAGADIVAGHHPHVVQEIEEYAGGIIAYSLGNFIFDQNFSEETMHGLLLEVSVDEDNTLTYTQRVVEINEKYQPRIR